MRRFMPPFFCLWLALGANLSAAEVRVPRKVAFLVGVNTYDHGLEQLQYAERDVEELEKTLKAGGFEVVMLTGKAKDGNRATRKNIEARLKLLLNGKNDDNRIRQGDLLLAVFCGHGMQIKVGDHEEAFFCPADGLPDKTRTLFGLSDLFEWIGKTRGSTHLILMDACRNDPLKDRGVRGGLEGYRVALPSRTSVFFSCSRGETSHETRTKGGGHGLFTYAVLKGLRGEAAFNGQVAWNDLVGYVQRALHTDKEIVALLAMDKQTPVPAENQVPYTVLLPVLTAGPQSLERELVRVAPDVIRFCKDKKYNNIGVLKFLITRDGQTFTDTTGTLNLFLARRLAVALLECNDAAEPLGIIEDASTVAFQTQGANHLTPEGRSELFKATYKLPYGENNKPTPVKADAFITGEAVMSNGGKILRVTLQAFDNREKEPVPFCTFKAGITPQLTSELAVAYLRPGFMDKAVELEIRYDGREVLVEHKDGEAWVPEPEKGQKVELVLRRDGSKERYAVVLKVNGLNTIDKEKEPDLHCRGWVLEPGCRPVHIRGYQINNKEAGAFEVQSEEESARQEINYGDKVGLITMTVFREGTNRPKVDPSIEAQKVANVARATLRPQAREGLPTIPKNYHALRARLHKDALMPLIVQGKTVPNEVKVVSFKADPEPILTLAIRYYRPRNE